MCENKFIMTEDQKILFWTSKDSASVSSMLASGSQVQVQACHASANCRQITCSSPRAPVASETRLWFQWLQWLQMLQMDCSLRALRRNGSWTREHNYFAECRLHRLLAFELLSVASIASVALKQKAPLRFIPPAMWMAVVCAHNSGLVAPVSQCTA